MLKPSILWTVLLHLALALGGFAVAQADDEPAITEVGRPLGMPSVAFIGPEGGEVRSPDGALTVTVAPGAVANETEVGVQLISNHAPLGIGGGYRLTPEGVDFAEPVTLTFAYDDGVLAGQPAEFLWFISQNASGSWSPQRSSVVDTEAKTVTVSVRHFSDWAVGRFIDLKLEPAQSLVSPGESVVLGITGFIYDPDRDEGVELVPLDDALVALTEGRQLLDSTERYVGFQVQDWRLNGRDAPGNPAHGTLDPLERRALYTAPDTAPNPDTVAVSVDLRATNRDDSWHQYTLVASITVNSAEHYITLNAPDGQFLFIGGPDFDGTEPKTAGDAAIATIPFFGVTTLSISGISHLSGQASINFATEGTTPGSYPAWQLPENMVNAGASYRPDNYDGSNESPDYVDYYPHFVRVQGFCAIDSENLPTFTRAPFTVTIDRIETDDDRGFEVIYGSYAGTLYDISYNAFEDCVVPPRLSAAVSGTFKLPLDRLDWLPGMDWPQEPADDEPMEDEDFDLVPLAPPG